MLSGLFGIIPIKEIAALSQLITLKEVSHLLTSE